MNHKFIKQHHYVINKIRLLTYYTKRMKQVQNLLYIQLKNKIKY